MRTRPARSIRRTRAEVVFIVEKVSRARSPIVRGSSEGLPASVNRANCWAGVRPPFVGSIVIVLRTDSKNRRKCAIVR